MLNQVSGNLLSVLAPLFIMLALGFLLLVVWLFWVMSRREKRKQNASQSPVEQSTTSGSGGGLLGWLKEPDESKDSSLAASAPVAAVHRADDDAVEVFRVMRDLADGSLIVEIDSARYLRLADITDAQVGRRFMANARALAHFALILKGPPPAPPVTEAAPAIQNAPQLEPQMTAPENTEPLDLASVLSPPRATPDSSEVESVKMRPLDGLRKRKKDADEEQEPAAGLINLADEIEGVLQHQLTLNPQFAQRSIHVRPGLDGGVRIEVDGTFYDGVGAVPDTEVREFIQETIRAWEARS